MWPSVSFFKRLLVESRFPLFGKLTQEKAKNPFLTLLRVVPKICQGEGVDELFSQFRILASWMLLDWTIGLK